MTIFPRYALFIFMLVLTAMGCTQSNAEKQKATADRLTNSTVQVCVNWSSTPPLMLHMRSLDRAWHYFTNEAVQTENDLCYLVDQEVLDGNSVFFIPGMQYSTSMRSVRLRYRTAKGWEMSDPLKLSRETQRGRYYMFEVDPLPSTSSVTTIHPVRVRTTQP